jgi:serine/threonine protein kinase
MTPEQAARLLEIVERQPELGGRFRNAQRISAAGGNGAFSLVFRAVDTQSANREVALKFLNPFEPDEYRRKSFQREPEMLEHFVGQRDIVQLIAGRSDFTHDLGGFPIPFAFYAVELADADLASRIEAKLLSLPEVLLTFRVMCRAVQRIQAKGVAHRDVKPANFLIMKDGTLKLSDFGTARIVDDASEGILADYRGFAPGDWGYSPPEMIASLHDVDARIAFGADIFGLGASLFEMLTGVPLGLQLWDFAFQEDLADVMAAVKRADRQRIYDKFVTALVNSRPLPSVAAFAPELPPGAIPELDDLYRSVSHLDYRHRLVDFTRIFWKISRCLIILKNDEKFRRWQERRLRERTAAANARNARQNRTGPE